MAKKGKKTIVRYTRGHMINIGTIMFGILFIYMLICLFMYLNTEHITAYEVNAGPLSGNYQYTAIALRDEQIIDAEESGNINYYFREGTKAGKGNVVCSIGDENVFSDSEQSSATEMHNYNYSGMRGKISSFSTEFDSIAYQKVYNFQADMVSDLLEMSNEKTMENSFDANSMMGMGLSSAPNAGIVVYSIDGYETKKGEDVSKNDFQINTYRKKNLRLNKQAVTGSEIYKLIVDESWKLVFPLDEKVAKELSERDSIRFRILKDGIITQGDFQIIRNKDGQYGEITLNDSMVRYAMDRYLDIELILYRKSGLKIPKSAIEEKIFYNIPKEFAAYDENQKTEIRLLKRVQKKDGSYGFKTVHATIYKESENGFYVENNLFSDGDIILKPDSNQQYTIGEKKALQGVYNINKGYAVFREITIIDENEEYCIVEEGSGFGLAQFDHIALDASVVSDQDIVY